MLWSYAFHFEIKKPYPFNVGQIFKLVCISADCCDRAVSQAVEEDRPNILAPMEPLCHWSFGQCQLLLSHEMKCVLSQ